MKFPQQDDSASFSELPALRKAADLKEAVLLCVSASRLAGQRSYRNRYVPQPEAARAHTSPESLDSILSTGEDIHGISSRSEVSNALVFGAPHIEGAVSDWKVRLTRLHLDRKFDRLLRRELNLPNDFMIQCSGHFWYPPGSYMSWHTNSRAPGWRCYLSFVAEPEKSCFHLRDPDSGEILTSWDRDFDIRLFRVEKERPLWHCVYSNTDRFSFGFRIGPGSRHRRALTAVKRHLGSFLLPVARRIVKPLPRPESVGGSISSKRESS